MCSAVQDSAVVYKNNTGLVLFCKCLFSCYMFMFLQLCIPPVRGMCDALSRLLIAVEANGHNQRVEKVGCGGCLSCCAAENM